MEENLLKKMEAVMQRNKAISSEILWANIFHDTIKNSKWLCGQSFSPGRAAIGYPTLYALYRILDEFQPENILEMGLGQSTKMIGTYAKWKNAQSGNCKHIVVEHDKTWIEFFANNFELSDATEIMQMDLIKPEIEIYSGKKTEVNMYKDFKNNLTGKKFDLIFIDGPFGSNVISRIDIIDLLPECLNQSFIFMMDDAERLGEQNTLKMVTNILKENSIKYARNYYSGEKATAIITSENLHFFCTM